MSKLYNIPLMVPDIRQEDIDVVVEVLRSGMLVQGKWVEKLEEEIARYLGVKHAIAVSSGTASLHLALVALGIGLGDEVIVPAFSFVATANVVEVVGAKPVFVDIDIDSFNINTSQIEQVVTEKTKAIMPVHEFGLACDITKVMEIATKYDLKVIEDAACALGAQENGKFVGSFGDIGSFSFHPRKAITSGEGGILTTNDSHLANNLRMLRNHGISYVNDSISFSTAGLNYRMTDYQAALLVSQLGRFEQLLKTRNEYARLYNKYLGECDFIKLPMVISNKRHTWQSFHVLVKGDRDRIVKRLSNLGIGCNLGAQCIPSLQYYTNRYGFNGEELYPNASLAYKQGLVIPLYPSLVTNDILTVANELKKISHE